MSPPWSSGVLRLRRVVNIVNLATPVGLVVAKAGRADLARGPHGLVLAKGFRPPLRASAMTIGDVVLLRRDDEWLTRHPRLLDHEARHAFQYACWLGPIGFFPAYLACAGWSLWRTGDPALRNAFERRADLVDGNYVRGPDDPRLHLVKRRLGTSARRQGLRCRRPRRGRS
jgi:hypothetical protein